MVADCGGIYTFGAQGPSFASGILIRGNVVHDVRFPGLPGEFAFPNGFYILLHGNFWDDPEPGWWPLGAPLPDSVLVVGNMTLAADDPDAACRATLGYHHSLRQETSPACDPV